MELTTAMFKVGWCYVSTSLPSWAISNCIWRVDITSSMCNTDGHQLWNNGLTIITSVWTRSFPKFPINTIRHPGKRLPFFTNYQTSCHPQDAVPPWFWTQIIMNFVLKCAYQKECLKVLKGLTTVSSITTFERKFIAATALIWIYQGRSRYERRTQCLCHKYRV